MTIKDYLWLEDDKKEDIKKDIQAMYLNYIIEHSATLAFAKIMKMTNYSKAIIKHCLYSDEPFKTVILDLNKQRLRVVSASLTSYEANRPKVQF